jgi:hypothetical protein
MKLDLGIGHPAKCCSVASIRVNRSDDGITTFQTPRKVQLCWSHQRYCETFILVSFLDNLKGIFPVIRLQYLYFLDGQIIVNTMQVSAVIVDYRLPINKR